jgi:hypothetical protein
MVDEVITALCCAVAVGLSDSIYTASFPIRRFPFRQRDTIFVTFPSRTSAISSDFGFRGKTRTSVPRANFPPSDGGKGESSTGHPTFGALGQLRKFFP